MFAPAPGEVAEARSIIDDYRRAEAAGVGAVRRDGGLVDAALMRHARNVLRRAGVAADAAADTVATKGHTS